jgi:hypothetical protein
MGNDDGDRCRGDKTQGASDLVACILREVDAANARLVELRDAVSRADRQRAARLKVDVNAAWLNAEAAITKLERLSGQRETVARAALKQSQASARSISAALWKLVLASQT